MLYIPKFAKWGLNVVLAYLYFSIVAKVVSFPILMIDTNFIENLVKENPWGFVLFILFQVVITLGITMFFLEDFYITKLNKKG